MKSKELNVTESTATNVENYTPPYEITPILPYLKPKSTIWCPFDTEQSYYAKVLLEAGHRVVHTHLANVHEFFVTEPPQDCDYIISNPPFVIKAAALERLLMEDLPFATLVDVVGLNASKERFNIFRDYNYEVLYLDNLRSNPPFSVVYVCQDATTV